jgi:polyisoprenoid-binding protein YceI
MKKMIILAVCVFGISLTTDAQKYFTREGKITFFSEAPMEKIEAHNNSATSVIDVESARMEFAVLIKAFQFEKALMQEHFNENYMESSKFPKAVFKGEITNMDAIDLSKDGSYDAEVKGKMTIHGVTKEVSTTGTFVVKNGTISAQSSFEIAVADYDIEIPAVVKDNIAKIVRIDVDVDYEKLDR